MGVSYITAEGRKKLPKYQYKGTDRSIFYKHISSPACDVLCTYIPKWVAPNLITLIGLLVMLGAHCVVVSYAPDLKGEIPSWVCVLQAMACLVYQTLDNLDGKQARRTGTSSPLGLLFDHGIDALVVTVGGLSLSAVFQFGETWKTLCFWIAGATGFYMASWEEYYTNEFDLPPINGPSEGILIFTALELLTAWKGVGIWNKDSLIPGVQNNSIFVYGLLLGSWATVLGNVTKVFKSPYRRKVMKVSFARALSKILPFVALNSLAFLWLSLSKKNIMELHPRLVVWTLGLAFAKLVMLLIVAHMCDEEYHPWRRSIIPIFFMAAHVCYSMLQKNYDGLDEKLIIEELFVVSVLAYSHMAYSLVNDCCKILDINCFTIKKQSKDHAI
ncbi:CDP-alcohol phosphatidyltransferase [Chloropicon primus]|uniref:CDP-alcohol phosphatidyltransferase n=1 Tax=Chloropicon primus TaxID=1764295 RepID=A0A5B8N2C8_9CHLO|nr:CDP-alcohol phosphatidyltransferase [Chloropicon primus]UPR05221.1 CDP-alcohol phosphatidyltransferase [Chloropicon primus]|mmetsp:Transcript_4598/g.13694  ORF Transcript_4598/g.13694 Transcript_4598/m.13694 type:complete len:386 (-) Transcript_4598:1391-2548(-)|eukprot:QDZ26020.1 CDP-alcohol phosphatidyltransferase [Chloropicon primus]